MLRPAVLCLILFLNFFAHASAQVHNIGSVSFAVPNDWQYQQGPGFGAMTYKTKDRFWLIGVYSPIPATADPAADFRAAWKRVVLAVADYQGVPRYDPYDMTPTTGYSGKYYDAASSSQQTYTRLYTLRTGNVCIPVTVMSLNRQTLDLMGHYEQAIVGSVRMAPAQASPIQFSLQIGDLAGVWKGGLATSTAIYNRAGQYQGNNSTAVNYIYTIAADGRYTYKFNGLMNNRAANDDDAGVIELGGEFLTFKGTRHTNSYRFVNLQQALDGSTVLALLPPLDFSKIDVRRDVSYLTRAPKR